MNTSGVQQPMQLPDWSMQVEFAKAGDHSRLLEIYCLARKSAGCYPPAQVSLENFERQINGEAVLGAYVEGRVLGFAAVWVPERFIHHLYVCPEYHRKGIGTQLIEACRRLFSTPLSLKCDRCNFKAMEFYKRHGWIAKSEGIGDYGPWDHMFLE